MTLQGLIDFWRSQVGDEAAPYLWSDPEALIFAIDAQDTFVRRMGGISCNTIDAASDPTNLQLHDLPLSVGVPYTAFSPYILRIRSGKLLTAKMNVKIIGESEAPIASVQLHDYSGGVASSYLDDTDTGPVTAAVIGLVDYQLRWVKVPSSVDTCRLHIYRLPYPRIADQDGTIEIEEQHHLALAYWMKYLSYSKEDAETYDKDLAAKNEMAFDRYCATARAEKERQRFKPRITHYGGL